MTRFLKSSLIVVMCLLVAYLVGPHPLPPKLNTELPTVSSDLRVLEQDIQIREKNTAYLKPDNQARIVWADSLQKKKTTYSVVYLHGFTASYAEGAPIHTEFARRYGCNLYFPRLDQHGLDNPEPLLNVSPESLLASAKEAVAIGQQLGEKTILMCTSTGATMGLFIASEHPEIEALIIYSPLIDFHLPILNILNQPWGLQIARLARGSKYNIRENTSKLQQKYWTTKFRLEGTIALKSLEAALTKPDIFKKIKQPMFLGYYYKDEENQDKTISVAAARKMFETISTPTSLKVEKAFPNAKEHVIGSYITTKAWKDVRDATFKFAEEVIGLKAVK